MIQTQRRDEVGDRGSAGSSKADALDKLVALVKERRGRGEVPTDFGAFERNLHAQVMEVERELLAEELARADVDTEAVEVGGVVYRRVVRCSDTYVTAAGPVRVERTLYRDRTDASAHAICPMELRLGIIEARWTPHAAALATWVVAHLTPALSEELFARIGNMTPSKSALDRLPKHLLDASEADRAAFESALRDSDTVPDNIAVLAVSLDGVMAPMKDGERTEKRADTASRGQLTRGPAGYREVGCGTLSMYNDDGDLLRVVRMVEAACKTLVAQRLKLSGMRWSNDGGQAILNLRAWHQSDRFDHAWALIAAQYKAEVTTIANVIHINR